MKPSLLEAYKLLERGTLAFAEIEATGIRIDTEYLDRAIRRVTKKIDTLHAELLDDPLYREWQRLKKGKISITSRQQLHDVLTAQGHKLDGKTEKGNAKKDDSSLRKLKLPFVDKWLEWDRLKVKVRGTYLEGIKREVVDGRLHCGLNLNTVVTYRSSSSEPNLHNYPIRSPEYGKIIRRCFVPDPGCVLIEIDFVAIEVRVSCCYHKDPTLISYVKDKTKDMHRDMAAECYMIPPELVSKESRYCAKNQFVFPQFYGSVYFQCAPALWDSIGKMKLMAGDVPLREHLRSQGIKKLGKCDPKESPVAGTFENHIREVEQRFWNERFPIYTRWKEDWYRQYRDRGYFYMKTGFRCSGLMRRNDVLNYGIQGSSSHCKLWALIEIMREIKKQKMGSRVVGEIHDSILGCVPVGEIDDYINMAKEIMTDRLVKEWKWIIVPLEVEVDVADHDWHSKVQWTDKGNGKWGPKDG